MAITNLLLKIKPEEIPEFLRGKFFELHDPDAPQGLYPSEDYSYVGWLFIKEDGIIEIGEPGA